MDCRHGCRGPGLNKRFPSGGKLGGERRLVRLRFERQCPFAVQLSTQVGEFVLGDPPLCAFELEPLVGPDEGRVQLSEGERQSSCVRVRQQRPKLLNLVADRIQLRDRTSAWVRSAGSAVQEWSVSTELTSSATSSFFDPIVVNALATLPALPSLVPPRCSFRYRRIFFLLLASPLNAVKSASFLAWSFLISRGTITDIASADSILTAPAGATDPIASEMIDCTSEVENCVRASASEIERTATGAGSNRRGGPSGRGLLIDGGRASGCATGKAPSE